MKKSLLLGTALLVGAGAFAQANRQKAMHGVLYPKANPAPIDMNEGTANQRVKSNNSVQTQSILSNSRNGFGTLVESTSPLQYNEDLNMLAFTHRLPTAASWPTTGLTLGNGTSGFQVTNYSTDGGATWNGVCYYQNNSYWGRYPSGVIANTPGNTDASQAKFVAMGPCTGSGSSWWGNFFASVPANATGNVTTNDQQALDIQQQNAATWTYFASYNSTTNGSTVWTGARKYDGTTFKGAAVIKGVRGATVNDPYTWTQDSVTFGPFMVSSGNSTYATDPKVAFAKDGLTGYVLVSGVLASATGNAAKSLQPNVWKTTDGGNTWALVNAGYDWKANHPEILCNLVNASGETTAYPAFFEAHGAGVTVDCNGVLHYVTTVVPGYSSHPDSLFYLFSSSDNSVDYGFSFTQGDILDVPYIYDFSTKGDGIWSVQQVGVLYTRNIQDDDAVPDPAAWTTDGTAPMDYVSRVRVSRNNAGTNIFYSWTDGDTSSTVTVGTSTLYHANTNPSFFYRGLDLSTGLYSPIAKVDAFDAPEAGYYSSYVSPIAMRSASGNGYVLPATFMVSQGGDLNATNSVDYYFMDDMVIADNAYTMPIAYDRSSCFVGMKELTGSAISSVQNFPNPFSATTTVKVNLNKSEDITVNVMNSIGQVVLTKSVKGVAGQNELTIDAANLNSGIYFYSVIAGDSKVTSKMTVSK